MTTTCTQINYKPSTLLIRLALWFLNCTLAQKSSKWKIVPVTQHGQHTVITTSQKPAKIIDQRVNNLNMSYTKLAKPPSKSFSSMRYRPKLDISELCTEKEHHFYQQMLGITQWMIELHVTLALSTSHWTISSILSHVLLLDKQPMYGPNLWSYEG